MTMPRLFTDPDAWSGGDIELLLFFDAAPVERVRAALEAAWSWPHLHGPFGKNTVEPDQQELIAANGLNPEESPLCYGVATLPNGGQTAFRSYVVPDDKGWCLYLGAPLGGLGRVYEIGAYPLEGSPDAWTTEVHGWLLDLARWIHPRAGFDRGAIGTWLTDMELDELATGAVPDERHHGTITVENGELKYFPRNAKTPLLDLRAR